MMAKNLKLTKSSLVGNLVLFIYVKIFFMLLEWCTLQYYYLSYIYYDIQAKAIGNFSLTLLRSQSLLCFNLRSTTGHLLRYMSAGICRSSASCSSCSSCSRALLERYWWKEGSTHPNMRLSSIAPSWFIGSNKDPLGLFLWLGWLGSMTLWVKPLHAHLYSLCLLGCGWQLMLICYERTVLLTGSWWLVLVG